ncbi:MAG: thioredoxin domain-containing protein [candidate division KSB1 bacterium]|nr:thioredoxin domain-containing protein [candidate division KSB1 bacterium]
MTQSKHTNHLIHETSPYLLQHAHNLVNWYPWGEEALQLARKLDRPIFLSIGYSACHWCHVMAHESFENEAIAKILNDYFISIKVDREERPDLDEIYMTAVQLMTGSGGWPLSVWLTPDLEPFYGGTYFPPEDRWGRVGFRKILLQIAQIWQQRRGDVVSSARQITASLKQINEVQSVDFQLDQSLWHSAFKSAEQRFDERYGGFGSAPKFPMAMELSFLLRYYFHTGQKRALAMVEKSLQEMANGGIFDHLGGGFHRYSTDERWLVPHFEKMLYDNALLAITYLEAYQLTRNVDYKETASATLDYVLREMTSPEGGFYSSQDADSEGEEGKFYVWHKSDIEAILGKEDAKLFCDIYDVSDHGNWEGKNILHLRRSLEGAAREYGISLSVLKDRLAKARWQLFAVRSQRVPPATDDKILTDWNSLMISACCKGYQILGDPKYLTAAQKAVDFLLEKLYIDRRILKTYRNGKSHLNGYLSDYAFMVAALIDLYESNFEWKYLSQAIEINEIMLQKFWDEQSGGFYFTPDDHERLIVRTRNAHDNAVPAGNSVAVHNLLKLSQFTGDFKLKQQAERTLKLFASQMQRSPSGFSVLLCSLDYFWGKPKEIVIAGDRQDSKTKAMIEAVHHHYLPNKILVYADPKLVDQKEAILPVFEGKISQDGKARMFVCENYACQRPISDLKDFYDLLNDH